MKKTKEQLAAEEVAKKAAEAEKEGEGKDKKEDFAKDDEKVDANKFNQALRKAREAEAEKRELELEKQKLEEVVKKGTQPKKEVSPKKEDEEKEDEDDFWEEKKKEEPISKIKPAIDSEAIKAIINEQIRPFVEAETNRKKIEKKQARQSFYDKHPEYLQNADKWADLLDELGSSIVPSGDYYADLEKAHRIIGGEDFNQVQIEQKKKEIANDAGNSGGGSPANRGNEGEYKFSAMDKKIIEGTGVDAETIKKMRKLQKEGKLSLEF